jgi:TonB family protein
MRPAGARTDWKSAEPRPATRPPRRLGPAAGVAIAIHLQALAIGALLAHRFAPRNADLAAQQYESEGEPLYFSPLDEEASNRILAELERLEDKARQEQARKEQEAPKPPGQVVEIGRPQQERRPKDARYAAEFDSSVEREIKKIGRIQAETRSVAPSAEAAGANGAAPPTSASQPARPPGLLAMRTPVARSPTAAPAPNEGPPPTPEDPRARTEDGALPAPSPRSIPEQAPVQAAPGATLPEVQRPLALLPTGTQVARAVGAGTQDHLPDVQEGDGTALNAKSWRFASFFNRVKRQVVENWKPVPEYEKRDPTGRIYGAGMRVTILRIALKPDGALASLAVEQPSGLDFLDDVAVEAVKRGQPFVNPPPQLVETKSGLITFRFGFFFEVGSAPRTKVYRYSTM